MLKSKKIIAIMAVAIILLGIIVPNVLAAELKTKLEVVKSETDRKYLENNQGYISNDVIDSNGETGEVTVRLKIENTKKIEDEAKQIYDNTEIFIVVSENIARDEQELNNNISYINTLATKIFEKNENTKIGIIGMTGTVFDGQEDENGNMIWGENDEGAIQGNANNAEVLVQVTDNIESIKNGLQTMNANKIRYRDNLQAAIRLANNSYSKDVNKILVLLYDGVPTIAIGVESQVRYGGWLSEYATAEEASKAKYEKISDRTRTEILALKENNVDLILLRPADTSYDKKLYDVKTGELILEFDGSPYVQKIYGTLENPTHGKMYSLNNDNLEKIVTEYIYNDVISKIGFNLKSVEVKHYFSKEILDNFDITFSEDFVDTTNLYTDNYITWNADELNEGDLILLEYTLQIKDMKNVELLDKVLSTSEKTEVSYVDYLEQNKQVVSEESPEIKLTEVKEELVATVTYDPTEETTGNVTAIIKTNKKVNEVDGWELSEDGMTLTKIYSKNATEVVHLVDIDGMTKDVTINISNIIVEEIKNDNNKNDTKNETVKDDTIAKDNLPDTGKVILLWIIGIVSVLGIVAHIRYKKLYM